MGIRQRRNGAAVAAVIAAVGIVVCVLLFLQLGRLTEQGAADSLLKVTFLKVGKADAIVIQAGGEAMVIDTGEDDDGEELTEFLAGQGISYVDTLIITHFDKDHVGGADTLAASVEIGQVLVPAYEGSSTEYLDFMQVLEEKGITPKRLTQAETFKLGEAEVLAEPPSGYEIPEGGGEYDNDFSIITTVTHGENRLLFTGDAEKKRIREWISEGAAAACDLLKVPHHGGYNKALSELLEVTAPEYAVICSSEKNPADDRTLELLEQAGVQVFQTKDGNITATSDGSSLEVRQ